MIMLRRCALPALFALLLPSLCCAAEGKAPAKPPLSPRSLWVWNTAAIRAGGPAQAAFFQFLTAPQRHAERAIRTVYFDGIDGRQLSNPEVAKGVRRFLREAHARHLRVDFLTGDPHWATAAGQPEALGNLDGVLAFNRAGAPAERYDGFQYDVEPYALPEWPAPALRQGLLDLLDRSNAKIKASGQRLILSAAIPRWLDQPQFGFLDQGVIDRTDEIAIMDYVHTADSLVADAQGELEYAAKVHKKVWIGVETLELKDTPQITFFGRGVGALEQVLAEATPRLRRQPAFAGYAIHHWDSYARLKP